MKIKKESLGYVVSFTFAICLVFVLVLAVANQLTLSRVEANKRFASQLAVLKAFGLAQADSSRAEVEASYASSVAELKAPEGVGAAYKAEIDGQPFVAVQVTGAGLWGPITAILAADPAVQRVKGMDVLDQQETPGLGGRIGEAWFTSQFAGEKVGPQGTIAVRQGSGKGDQDKENSQVDAVTGASRTSDFVQSLVNSALKAIKDLGGSL
jgi:Na+-transporting NADH:ubiquinone oxidoreductase subunit C